MVNRYYAGPPGKDLTQGLEGLGNIMTQIGERKAGEEAKQTEIDRIGTMRKEGLDAVNSGDPEKWKNFLAKNATTAEGIQKAFEAKFPGNSGKAYKQSILSAYIDPSQAQTFLQETRKQFEADGLDPQEIAKLDGIETAIEEGPEAFRKMAKIELYSIGDKDMIERAESYFKEGKGDVKPTANIQDFQHYQTLLRENSTQAEAFARQVGIIKDDKTDPTTTAIKEFEYGEKNPKFKLSQNNKDDSAKTKVNKSKVFEDSSKLRKEFVGQSAEFKKVRDSFTRVVGSTTDPSPAGDLSLIFNYMKMLDPGSVVRESEFATAASSGSYGQRIQASVQKVLSGERLAPEMRKDFVSKAGTLMEGMQKQHRKREKNYTFIAEKNSLPVDEVVVDINAPEPEEIKYTEGQTATGPNGEKMIYRNGNWEVM